MQTAEANLERVGPKTPNSTCAYFLLISSFPEPVTQLKIQLNFLPHKNQ